MSWAVFLSGRGSNAEALFEMSAHVDIRLCVSSRKNALGLCRARRAGVPTLLLEKEPDWSALTEQLRARNVKRIFLLGFMKILPSEFVQKWQGKMWNLHPSLLPNFPGRNAAERSFQEGEQMGVTIHQVTAEMDAGPRLLQYQIPGKPQTLQAALLKISQAEQRLVRESVGRLGWT